MKINVETVSPVERKLTIEVPPERVAKELDKAYQGVGRRARLPGFRPGHIPRAVLERNFRPEVERDVAERLVNLTFAEAAEEKGIEPVATPNVSLDGPLVPGATFRFSAKVEVRPAIAPKDYRGLSVTRTAPVVTDASVQAELEKLRDRFGSLQPLEGRDLAAEGDWALIDHEGTIEGKPFEGGVAQGVSVRAAQGKIEEGNIAQLVGKKVGEVVEFDEPFAADHRNEPLRGKTAHMKVTLRGLQVRQLPALDDDFAKMVGVEGLETLEALRGRIRADLEKREKRKADGDFKDALIKAALARNDFEVPPSMVERTIDNMLEGTVDRFARMGLDVAQLDLDVARLRGDLREQALLQVRGSLLLDAVATVEKLVVEADDLQAELSRLAEEAGVPVAKVQQQMRSAEARAALHSRVREEKALSLLAEAASVTAGQA
jgi:trigger factor